LENLQERISKITIVIPGNEKEVESIWKKIYSLTKKPETISKDISKAIKDVVSQAFEEQSQKGRS